MFFTYIIKSVNHPDKYYVGFTHDLEGRLSAHNHPSNKGYTARYMPWELVYSESFATKSEAMAREKWLKSGVGRQWMKEYVK
ncbi:MAG: GIY-YIG nuclease family protein [Cytophagales bacterium]|nr:GIY-YIG nuclease family protein [Cytophagales bacterium]